MEIFKINKQNNKFSNKDQKLAILDTKSELCQLLPNNQVINNYRCWEVVI